MAHGVGATKHRDQKCYKGSAELSMAIIARSQVNCGDKRNLSCCVITKKGHWTFASVWGFITLVGCIVILIVTVLKSIHTDHDQDYRG